MLRLRCLPGRSLAEKLNCWVGAQAVCQARRAFEAPAPPSPTHPPCPSDPTPAEKRKAEAAGEEDEDQLRLEQEQAEFDRAKVGAAVCSGRVG